MHGFLQPIDGNSEITNSVLYSLCCWYNLKRKRNAEPVNSLVPGQVLKLKAQRPGM
jgi:hypothetical protein